MISKGRTSVSKIGACLLDTSREGLLTLPDPDTGIIVLRPWVSIRMTKTTMLELPSCWACRHRQGFRLESGGNRTSSGRSPRGGVMYQRRGCAQEKYPHTLMPTRYAN